jgi:hypothetical protein
MFAKALSTRDDRFGEADALGAAWARELKKTKPLTPSPRKKR